MTVNLVFPTTLAAVAIVSAMIAAGLHGLRKLMACAGDVHVVNHVYAVLSVADSSLEASASSQPDRSHGRFQREVVLIQIQDSISTITVS